MKSNTAYLNRLRQVLAEREATAFTASHYFEMLHSDTPNARRCLRLVHNGNPEAARMLYNAINSPAPQHSDNEASDSENETQQDPDGFTMIDSNKSASLLSSSGFILLEEPEANIEVSEKVTSMPHRPTTRSMTTKQHLHNKR